MSTQIATPETQPVPILPLDPGTAPDDAKKQREEKRKSYGPLLEFLKNTCKRVETEDTSERLNILGQQNRCQAFYDDRQYGKVNPKTGQWEADGYDPKEFKPLDNKYKEQVDKLHMEMARASVELIVEPVDQTDSAMKEAADFLRSRIEANRRRLFTQRPEFVLAEKMSLLLKTITYRYHYFDSKAEDGPRESKPKFEKTSLGEEKSLTVCGVCGLPRRNMTEIEPQPCSQCGSTSVKTLNTSPVEMELPAGQEEIPSGLPRCVHADPTMVQVSLNARMMSVAASPYLIWTQMVEQGKLERMFKDKVIPSGDDDSDQQEQTRRENETSVSNSPFETGSTTAKGGEQFKPRKFKLIWLDRWVYEDYSDEHEQKLPDGRVLPPRTPLVKFFPKGMCLAKVGDTLLAAWDEDKNKKWSVCVYGIREGAWHGSGTNALIPIQTTINDLLSYRLANVYYNTFTREFIRKDAISGETLPSIDKVCVVTNLDENQRIVGNVYDRAPGTPLPAEVPNLAQEQAGSLQEQAGTSSLSLAGTSAQTQALGTATGIAAMRDLSVGRMGPNLILVAAMEIETAFILAEMEQGNYSRQQLMAFAGLRPGAVGNLGYTARGVDAFINSNVRADFLITPIPGSWMPETAQEKKADALAFADVASKTEDPEIRGLAAKAFNQPLSVGSANATHREAQRRMEEFSKVVTLLASRGYTEPTDEMAQAVLDSAANAMLNETMDDHSSHIEYLRDWWVSDESRNAPALLKKVVEVRTLEHKDALTGEMTDANVRTIETQIPNKLAQVESAKMDQEAAIEGQEAQGEVEMEQQTQALQLQQQESELELATMAEKNALSKEDREHKLGISVLDRSHKAAIEADRQGT